MNKITVLALGLALMPSFAPAATDKKNDAAMQEMMKKAIEAGTPGEEHARLKAMEGKWNASSKMWMTPGDKPQESKGTSVFTMIMGGRFLKQDFTGDMGGQPFQGLGYLGYDNLKKEYTSTWMDTMTTGLMVSHGQFDPKAKVLRDEGTYACPMTGQKDRWFRSEWTLPEGDTSTFTMYSKDGSGKEFKSMEIVYKRAK